MIKFDLFKNTKTLFSPGWEKQYEAVRPFEYCNLLDERLDEAALTVIGSSVELYKPTDIVMIGIPGQEEGEPPTFMYYTVASDLPQELPNGSGKWKHDLSLIELTKLLEGVACQAVTFTNGNPQVFASDRWVVE